MQGDIGEPGVSVDGTVGPPGPPGPTGDAGLHGEKVTKESFTNRSTDIR
jgi:hypothetical protein